MDIPKETLSREGCRVSRAYSGTEALLAISAHVPDLVLLDLMLPGLSGEEVLPRIKGIPVIVVSAKTDMQNKVNLLLGGAADYITKPFDSPELLARITVALRRVAVAERSVLTHGALRLDTDTHLVTAGDRVQAQITINEQIQIAHKLCASNIGERPLTASLRFAPLCAAPPRGRGSFLIGNFHLSSNN